MSTPLRQLIESFRSLGQQPITAFPSPAVQALVEAARAQEWARTQAMSRAQNAYSGVYPDPLAPTADGRTDAIKVNHIAAIVDIAVAFLAGDPPDWELVPTPALIAARAAQKATQAARRQERALAPPPTPGIESAPAVPAPPEPDEPELADPDAARLEEILEANDWPSRLLDHAHNGSTTGTPYFRLYPPAAKGAPPRLRVLDSECMTVYSDPRDVETVTAYWWQYNTRDPQTKRTRVDRQRIERQVDTLGGVTWQITDEHADTTNAGDPQTWVLDGTETWPYAWPPVDHNKNRPNPGSVYGLPDVDDLLIALVNERNQNLTNRQRIDRFHGSPSRILTGATVDTLDISPDGLVELPADAKLDIIYPQVDSTAAAGLGKEIFEAICEMSATPSIVLGHSDQAQRADPSGVALRIKLWPAIIRTRLKRTLYGPAYCRVLSHLLELDGRPGRRVRLNWPELLPVDPLIERQVLGLDKAAGVLSEESYAEKVGLDYRVEQERIAAERAAAPPPVVPLVPVGDPRAQGGVNMKPGGMEKEGAQDG